MAVKRFTARVEDFAEPQIAGVQYWHLVRAKAMAEQQTAQMLEWMGIAAYVPLRIKTNRIGKSRFQIRHVPVKKAALAGYVFAGFRKADPDWAALFDLGLIRNVVTISSRDGRKPFVIWTWKVLEIYERQKAGEFDGDIVAYRERAKLDPGDRLQVVGDGDNGKPHPYFGREYEAQAVEEGRVGVLQDWFGKVKLEWLPLDVVRKMA